MNEKLSINEESLVCLETQVEKLVKHTFRIYKILFKTKIYRQISLDSAKKQVDEVSKGRSAIFVLTIEFFDSVLDYKFHKKTALSSTKTVYVWKEKNLQVNIYHNWQFVMYRTSSYMNYSWWIKM